ncbi:hypothetical protein QA646_00480 [Rhizobium sp. CB3090]|nr:hypothetical protein [Rhizobium sp. CB3090]WFU09381.1 hypothetical protein QA646_00480 [Rhizobium sp. CB3090]
MRLLDERLGQIKTEWAVADEAAAFLWFARPSDNRDKRLELSLSVRQSVL